MLVVCVSMGQVKSESSVLAYGTNSRMRGREQMFASERAQSRSEGKGGTHITSKGERTSLARSHTLCEPHTQTHRKRDSSGGVAGQRFPFAPSPTFALPLLPPPRTFMCVVLCCVFHPLGECPRIRRHACAVCRQMSKAQVGLPNAQKHTREETAARRRIAERAISQDSRK